MLCACPFFGKLSLKNPAYAPEGTIFKFQVGDMNNVRGVEWEWVDVENEDDIPDKSVLCVVKEYDVQVIKKFHLFFV